MLIKVDTKIFGFVHLLIINAGLESHVFTLPKYPLKEPYLSNYSATLVNAHSIARLVFVTPSCGGIRN